MLQFQAENDPAGFGLDDISVTAIPSSPVGKLSKSGNNALLSWTTTTGVTYQLQYKTNLLQTDWVNLGVPFTATTNLSSITDTNALRNSPHRWYRLVVQ